MAGLSLACSARVSSLLGAGTPAGARRAGLVALGLGVACEAVVAVALLCLSHQWPRLFTTVPAVIAATARLTPLLAASLIGDGANAVMQGLLRGAPPRQRSLLQSWQPCTAAAAVVGRVCQAQAPSAPPCRCGQAAAWSGGKYLQLLDLRDPSGGLPGLPVPPGPGRPMVGAGGSQHAAGVGHGGDCAAPGLCAAGQPRGHAGAPRQEPEPVPRRGMAAAAGLAALR